MTVCAFERARSQPARHDYVTWLMIGLYTYYCMILRHILLLWVIPEAVLPIDAIDLCSCSY